MANAAVSAVGPLSVLLAIQQRDRQSEYHTEITRIFDEYYDCALTLVRLQSYDRRPQHRQSGQSGHSTDRTNAGSMTKIGLPLPSPKKAGIPDMLQGLSYTPKLRHHPRGSLTSSASGWISRDVRSGRDAARTSFRVARVRTLGPFGVLRPRSPHRHPAARCLSTTGKPANRLRRSIMRFQSPERNFPRSGQDQSAPQRGSAP